MQKGKFWKSLRSGNDSFHPRGSRSRRRMSGCELNSGELNFSWSRRQPSFIQHYFPNSPHFFLLILLSSPKINIKKTLAFRGLELSDERYRKVDWISLVCEPCVFMEIAVVGCQEWESCREAEEVDVDLVVGSLFMSWFSSRKRFFKLSIQ